MFKSIIAAILIVCAIPASPASAARAVTLDVPDIAYTTDLANPITADVVIDARGANLAVVVACFPGPFPQDPLIPQDQAYPVIGGMAHLGPFIVPTWQPGGLDCTASLVRQFRNGPSEVLASDTFTVT